MTTILKTDIHLLKTIEPDLQQISDMLVLNGTLTEGPGLVNGKTGISIFFFHYAQYTSNMVFADYAMDLIGEVLEQIHANSSADYEKGIAGIGMGMDYLIRNKFLITEENLYEDFDQRMYRAVMYDPWQDFSMYDGLTGYGKYWLARFHHQPSSAHARGCLSRIIELIEEQLQNIPVEELSDIYVFLQDLRRIDFWEERIQGLCRVLDRRLLASSNYFPRLGNSLVGKIARKHQHKLHFNVSQESMSILPEQLPSLDLNTPPSSTGLLHGYAGEGLLRLTAIGQGNESWLFLL